MERYRLPIPIQSYSYTAPNISVFYPQVTLVDPLHEQKINHSILRKIDSLFLQIKEMGYFEPGSTELIGDFEMKNNQRGIISFTFSLFANMPGLAHPVELLDSLTADAQSGEIYELSDLFKTSSGYEQIINKLIEQQIQERDIPLLDNYPGISPDQKYYIADKTLVIYFDKYEITPGYAGFPMFPIPAYQLEDFVTDDSPLYILSM
ncbi:Protein of unknown function [Alteribacillus persepolensis]|uniref:DUF3298 domain-containing protein n=1 Tax=Alteribacillus persepolensis TaxID=568899 RepID=A0A1G8C2C8_9BACI|nr:DUF3298 and DUF4163 domain-containing protein [Alteribacillus persepolensis]SDH39651.1 Protein of unknown function [Alteribacillus persepolensis]